MSHAHPDHFGLLRFINKNIPIYTTKITKNLMKTCSKILYNNLFDDLKLLEMQKEVKTQDFVVQGLTVNHSVWGACAFLITDKRTNKKILYSGDLRLHGRSISDFKNIKPDYLIIEGTNLSGENSATKTEFDIENLMKDIFSQNKMSVVCCSPINTDRIISVYNACVRSEKTFVIDPYSALFLETFKGENVPNYKSDNIKVYCTPNGQSKKIFEESRNKKFGNNKISFDEIMAEQEKYVIKYNHKVLQSILLRKPVEDINLVYSYWEGYLENENQLLYKYRDKLKILHTSGHIYQSDLVELIKNINPKKIIPVHTLRNDRFVEFFHDKVLELKSDSVLNF